MPAELKRRPSWRHLCGLPCRRRWRTFALQEKGSGVIKRQAYIGFAAIVVAMSAAPFPQAAHAQEVRVAAGFEKVHRDLRKKEAVALKDIGRADMEAGAADALAAQGEKLLAESIAAIEAQQVAYRAAIARLGAAANAQEANAEARALADIARGWGEAEQRRAKAMQMLASAEADRTKADARRAAAVLRLDETRLALERTLERAPGAIVPVAESAVAAKPGPAEPAAAQPASASRPAPKPIDEELLGGAAPLKSD